MKSASSSEASSAKVTALGMIPKNLPSVPLMSRSGRNAAAVVLTAAITGQVTSLVPTTAASGGLRPSSMCRQEFSQMMIASSTTMPSTRIRPKRDSMLMVIPTYCSRRMEME
jgi:hypothetical protein